MREKIDYVNPSSYHKGWVDAKEKFQEEIEKLKPLSDEEIKSLAQCYVLGADGWLPTMRNIAQAQLAKTKSDLRKVME